MSAEAKNIKTTITNTTIVKAQKDAKAMAERTGDGLSRYEVRDTKATGLILRVGPGGVQWQYRWQLRGKSFRLGLGDVDTWSIQEARDTAADAMRAWKSAIIPDDEWVQRRLLAKGKIDKPVAPIAPRLVTPKWTFEAARKAYLPKVKDTKSKGTFNDYRQKLQSRDMKVLDRRLVSSITRIEMAQLIAGVHASGRESTAESLVRIVGAFWTWLEGDTQITDSAVIPGTMKGLKAPERKRKPSKRIVQDPTLEDLGRIVAICRSGAVEPSIAAAIELVVWSCQRRHAVAAACELDFRAIGDGTEGLWYVYADDRKRSNGEAHVIPLPAPAWACVQRAIKAKAGSKSPYLFPQFRPRRKGDDVNHIHESTITHSTSYLPGVTSSPHKIRSIFGTYGESVLGFLRQETKVILDHSEGGQRTDVTGRHYALHDGTHAKWPIMRKWVDAVEADAQSAAETLEPVEEIKVAIEAARYGNDEDVMLQAAE